MPTETTTLPAIIEDAFDAAPDEPTRVLGERLKFVKGEWLADNESHRINGTKLVVYHFQECWQKWFDQRIVDTIRREAGKPYPLTAAQCESLGHDEGLGEWQEGRNLSLSDLDGSRLFAFATSSDGGIQAVDNLVQQIKFMRRRGRPGALPVVELGSTDYPHKIYGKVYKPVLTVRGWVTETGESYPTASVVIPPTPPVERLTSALGTHGDPGPTSEDINDLDADIPYR